jgi:hypothetical protein
MDALLTLAIYVVPFLVLAILIKRGMDRKGVGLGEVQAQGDPDRPNRARFLLGIWRREGRD